MLPFLEELLITTSRNYLDSINETGFMPDSESEEEDEEEYALYPDTDEHEDCYCDLCERKIDIYEPPITRLQMRNQETLINRDNKIIECLTEEINCLFEYMEEQKHYTEEEFEYKFGKVVCYFTEQNYRDCCDKINKQFKKIKANITYFNDISCIQLLMADNAITGFINSGIAQYKDSIKRITHLRKIIRIIQK